MTYDVNRNPPPKPESYPVEIEYRNSCGAVMKTTLVSDKDYYGFKFWNWGCRAAGQSQIVQVSEHRKDNGGDKVLGQSNE